MKADELKLLSAPKEPQYSVSDLREWYVEWYFTKKYLAFVEEWMSRAKDRSDG